MVLISATMGHPGSVSDFIYQAFKRGDFECVTSGPLVDEMAGVLVEEFGVPEDAVEDLVRVICRIAKVVSTTRFSGRPLPERLSRCVSPRSRYRYRNSSQFLPPPSGSSARSSAARASVSFCYATSAGGVAPAAAYECPRRRSLRHRRARPSPNVMNTKKMAVVQHGEQNLAVLADRAPSVAGRKIAASAASRQ